MFRFLLRIAILLGTGCAAIDTAPGITGSASTSDTQAVLALTREWADAEVVRDTATLQRILDDRFVMDSSDGTTIGKSAFIEAVSGMKMLSQSLSNQAAHVVGDTATTFGTATIHRLVKAEERTFTYRYTVVYLKRAGVWRAIALQMSAISAVK